MVAEDFGHWGAVDNGETGGRDSIWSYQLAWKAAVYSVDAAPPSRSR
jgi:hypothetical protein